MRPMSDTSTEALARRIARLEAIEDIKKLKARYWYSCDQKDVEAVRDCFAEGEVLIDYDGPVGKVNHRDQLYEVFANVGCQPNIVEIHHGGPPQIELSEDGETATAIWGLGFTGWVEITYWLATDVPGLTVKYTSKGPTGGVERVLSAWVPKP